MRINWSKIILALALILIGGLFYSANSINSKRSVKNIIIEFESSKKLFITKDSILKLIPTDYSDKNSIDINERKFQKALQVIERIAAMGVTNTEELPYYKIN